MFAVSKALRYIAFGLTAGFAALGGAFIIGETMTDPGGSMAMALVLSWLAPMIALCALAFLRPRASVRVLTVTAALVAGFAVIDTVFRVVPRDEVGPVATIAVFAVSVALGCLGLRAARPAGLLLLLVGVANLGGGASAMAVSIPALVIGGLFLLAGRWHSRHTNVGGPVSREATHRRL